MSPPNLHNNSAKLVQLKQKEQPSPLTSLLWHPGLDGKAVPGPCALTEHLYHFLSRSEPIPVTQFTVVISTTRAFCSQTASCFDSFKFQVKKKKVCSRMLPFSSIPVYPPYLFLITLSNIGVPCRTELPFVNLSTLKCKTRKAGMFTLVSSTYQDA